jgi:hypothetical protein
VLSRTIDPQVFKPFHKPASIGWSFGRLLEDAVPAGFQKLPFNDLELSQFIDFVSPIWAGKSWTESLFI